MDPALLWLVVLLLVLAGIAGTVLPALPGTPLIFLGLLLGAWIDRFQRVGWGTLATLALLALVAIGDELLATALGAQRAGASRLGLLGAAAGTLVGLFFGLAGILLGPFLGAVLGELAARRGPLQAGRAGFGTWLGILLGTAAKLAIACTMLGLFGLAYFL